MNSRQALVDVLLASGVSSEEEAAQLATIAPTNGNTWTADVLGTGKVDEYKLAANLAALFKSSTGTVDSAKIERSVLGLLPSRFVFKYQILPLEVTETTAKLATWDVFNAVARRLAQENRA